MAPKMGFCLSPTIVACGQQEIQGMYLLFMTPFPEQIISKLKTLCVIKGKDHLGNEIVVLNTASSETDIQDFYFFFLSELLQSH